jgi:1-aminocyclopropane-1-carboxylate deaminase/D-cysteine desulfhydrase-like pyridoxal-dependent ACC family enzyme
MSVVLSNEIRLSKSILTPSNLYGKFIYIKRDDLLNINELSGNKARKFYHLSNLKPFPSSIVSYGGHQSNAMLSLAKITNLNPNSEFIYYTKKVPKTIYNNPHGNLHEALSLGMKVNQNLIHFKYLIIY